jgi:hypothetical protein
VSGTFLLDVSVLVAFLWPKHINHEAVRAWFLQVRTSGWASCPITELGAVRVLANPLVSRSELSVTDAGRRLTALIAEGGHEFWPEGFPMSEIDTLLPYTRGHNQLTDRYLLALAASRSAMFATLDQSAASGLPSDSPLRAHLEIVRV